MRDIKSSAIWASSSTVRVAPSCEHPVAHWQRFPRRFVVGPVRPVYSEWADYKGALDGEPGRQSPVCGEQDSQNVGTVPSIRKARGNHHLWKKVSGPGAQFALALFSIHQPGNDSVWPVLLEPGMPVLPRFVPIAG